ncbi:hypothetical protein MNBD_GAMMA09-1602 [hydrothermal vent metagenome]|uniref:WD40 repeat domain-containing protein n=1 Tax=hydrothermal vent metagenome TaxID=652676 RepID=A0A3B0Y4G8_9ZZZZ
MKNNRVCRHLKKNSDLDYVLRFTGENNAFDLVCEKCVSLIKSNIKPDLYSIDQQAHAEIEEYNWLECKVPIIGEMKLPVSHPDFEFKSRVLAENILSDKKICAIEPHPVEPYKWFAVSDSGELYIFDVDTLQAHLIYSLLPQWIDLKEPLHLSVSADGLFIAVANCYGVYGEVINVQSSTQTMKLERSDYHVEHCYFPLVFTEYREQPLLIHATDWDHLDVSDPATGVRVVMHPEKFDSDRCEQHERAASFRGELLVSPDHNWIIDNGWEWHPVGAVSSWSIKNWIEKNPWEFVSSASMVSHTGKEYFWGQPVCWVNNNTVCIWGWGQDDCQVLPAVSFYDVETGERTGWLCGPDGSLVFDRFLFAYSADKGTTVWDVDNGNCVLMDASANAKNYHPVGQYFVDISDKGQWIIRNLQQK